MKSKKSIHTKINEQRHCAIQRCMLIIDKRSNLNSLREVYIHKIALQIKRLNVNVMREFFDET